MTLIISILLFVALLIVVFQLVGGLVEKIEKLEKRIEELEKVFI